VTEPCRSGVAGEQLALRRGGIEQKCEALVNLGESRLGHAASIASGCDVFALLLHQPTLP
jgi:hypothetical protein